MKLVTIDSIGGGEAGALSAKGEVVHLARAALRTGPETLIPRTVRDILEAGDTALSLVRALLARVDSASAEELDRLRRAGAVTAFDATPLLAPVPDPRLIVAVGLAYKSHLKEMANTPAPPHPSAFMKAPSSVNHPGAPIYAPPGHDQHIDFEGELAVVFGRTCHNVSAAEAMSYVAGFTCCNDVSARDWVKPVWEATEAWPARWSWEVNIMGKQFAGFTPLGPVLTTADEVADPSVLEITTRLNGQVMQSSPVSDLIYSVAEHIAYFSQWYTFRPGDVLSTGTPSGVGVGRKPPVFMKPGDVIEVEISRIGVLRNQVVSQG